MSTPPTPPAPGSNSPAPPPPPKKIGNPALEMMGIPKIRAKIPSKPWLAFIAVVTTWTGLIIYDRREKSRLKKQWCDRVAFLADQPLSPSELPRKIVVYLSAPPGDSLSVSRDFFKEYIKPVFTAAAVDFDVVEGRRPGELRWKVAERVRRIRAGQEEGTGTEKEEAVQELRKNSGVYRPEQSYAAVVVGRNTWKEYVRGVHEGWLGPEEPLDDLPKVEVQQKDAPMLGDIVQPLNEAVVPIEEPKKEEPDEGKKKKKQPFPPPTILPNGYGSAEIPRNLPSTLPTVHAINHPHLLGFFNFPFRIQRYLTQRNLADQAGREAAAIALGLTTTLSADEVRDYLKFEELDWPKKLRKELNGEEVPETPEEKERGWKSEKVWVEDVAVDGRIAERMRRFILEDQVKPEPGFMKDDRMD